MRTFGLLQVIRVTFVFLLFINACKPNQEETIYLNADLPVEERVEDLFGRMTLEEKVAQTLCSASEPFIINNMPDTFKMDSLMRNGIGEIRDFFHTDEKNSVRIHNKIQQYLVNKTRLGIPAIIHGEGLHGYVNDNATSFPQAIALSSSFNTSLVDSVYKVIAREARSRGVTQLLTPVVDVVRDPRWGRYSESYGEDPYLVGEMTVHAVRAMQGNDQDIDNANHVVATLKHFPGHGTTLGGLNCAPIVATERTFREIFMYPFEQAVRNAGALSVMASYGEYDGIPTHTNDYLLRDVLREQWGFKGIVVSDYFAIRLLTMGWQWEFYRHFMAKDTVEAAKLAIEAGVNVEMVEQECYPALVDLVKNGRVSEAVLDEMVKEVLRLKFKLGLFENPYVDEQRAIEISNRPESRELALEAAKQGVIMLKNENHCLPLNKEKYSKIAVIGPNANNVNLGDYSTEDPKYFVTVLEGIQNRAGRDFIVSYAEGCKITTPLPENAEQLRKDKQLIDEAVKVAQKADIVILAVGADRDSDREGRDRSNVQLVGLQKELIDRLASIGKPVVLTIFGGKVYAMPSIYQQSDAVFHCWNLGQETGNGLAAVLFGDYSPGGKLTVSIPVSEGHIPAYYNKKPSAYMRDYMFESNPGGAIYPFGFGLSYTTFEFSDLYLEKDTISKDENLGISVQVTNTGSVPGAEVVQLYVRDLVSSVTRPMKQLKDFDRVYLEPGESAIVKLEITPEKLAFYNRDMKLEVEPGQFEIMVGNSSRDEDLFKKVFLVQ
ncbi:MAG: glycoside hydrolase family 3 N-terminal domain-containing protein [Bacteroidota bacterium]